MNTNWTTPKRNFFAGLNDLRNALASGMNARLVRVRNEDCAHPIKVKNHDLDFRCYEFSIGYPTTRQKIEADSNMSDIEKELTLNYIKAFGTEEAMDTYYKAGVLSADNFKGMGRAHLVKASDYINFLKQTNYKPNSNNELIHLYERQYMTEQYTGSHFFDFFRLKKEHDYWTVKTFKRKVWAVELLTRYEPKRVPFLLKAVNAVVYLFKYVPKKSVLRMDNYKCVTFRIGAVTNGLSVEFHIPKKFSFN